MRRTTNGIVLNLVSIDTILPAEYLQQIRSEGSHGYQFLRPLCVQFPKQKDWKESDYYLQHDVYRSIDGPKCELSTMSMRSYLILSSLTYQVYTPSAINAPGLWWYALEENNDNGHCSP